MKKVSVKFGFANAIISDVIFKNRPTTGITLRNPKILSEYITEIKFQSIKGQTINHEMKLTHRCYLSHASMHAHTLQNLLAKW